MVTEIQFSPDKFELIVLTMQGFTNTQASGLIDEFDRGSNVNGRFVFHFTSRRGASGIVKSKSILASKAGFAGPGVYAGTTPTPNGLLKAIPLVGWGLLAKPIRIPIDLDLVDQRIRGLATPRLPASTRIEEPLLPLQTKAIRLPRGYKSLPLVKF